MTLVTPDIFDDRTPQLPIIDGAEMRLAMEVEIDGPRKDDYGASRRRVGRTAIREAVGIVSVNEESRTVFLRPSSHVLIREQTLARDNPRRTVSFTVTEPLETNAIVVFRDVDILADRSELIAPPLT